VVLPRLVDVIVKSDGVPLVGSIRFDGRGMSQHEVRWCFHTTAMVADYERTRDALVRLVGLRVLEDSRLEHPAIGRRGGMAWVGDNVIEIGEPIVDGGAVDRFVRRFGSHMSSVAVQVRDIDATVSFLEAHGAAVASRPEPHIVFTAATGTEGIVIEWFGDEEPLDPRFGAPLPPAEVLPLLEVTHMAFAGVIVRDPAAAAQRFATLFGREITFIHGDATAGYPQAGVSMGDMTLALYPVPSSPAESQELWAWAYERPQTCNLGLRVPDLAVARDALEQAGVTLTRHDDRSLVIGPEVTGGVVLVIVDELPIGDPRQGIGPEKT
jgi:catechol 2,3-dioxygenase-like lactoylglutathione lyase family enzyme